MRYEEFTFYLVNMLMAAFIVGLAQAWLTGMIILPRDVSTTFRLYFDFMMMYYLNEYKEELAQFYILWLGREQVEMGLLMERVFNRVGAFIQKFSEYFRFSV